MVKKSQTSFAFAPVIGAANLVTCFFVPEVVRRIKSFLISKIFFLLECLHYVTLQNADRKATYVASQQPFLCDYDLDAMWYRFEGAAGTKMPSTCVGPRTCGAIRPGWMNSAHPTVEDGRVNREVCFRSWYECCKYTKSIMVRNCSSFYVYHLDGIATNCSEAYCATD